MSDSQRGSMFARATKKQSKLRMALLGPAGSGKTYSALKIGRALVGPTGRIAVMDTEHGSASKYADEFEFDTVAPDRFDVDTYLEIIGGAGADGYDLLIIDSLSHAWAGKGGILEFVDNAARRSQSGSSFNAWRDATPKHNELVEAMLACRCHIIVTMRVKMEHVQEKDDRGKTVIRKVGLQPVQRDGLEYEFDVVGDLTLDNDLSISKTRCSALRQGMFHEPGEDIARTLRAWLTSGDAIPGSVPTPTPAKPSAPPAQQTAARAPVAAQVKPPLISPDWPRFWAHIKGLGVEHEEAHRALGIGSLKEWQGSLDEAITAIERYVFTRDTAAAQQVSTPAQPVEDAATLAQIRAIFELGRTRHRMSEKQIEDKGQKLFGVIPRDMSQDQAKEFIKALQQAQG